MISKQIKLDINNPVSFLQQIRITIEKGDNLNNEESNYIKKYAHIVKKLPDEKIKDELIKALENLDCPSKYFEVLKEHSLLQYILPELSDCINVKSNPYFHNKDVFGHTMDVLDFTPKNNIKLRLAALFHDLGKPEAFNSSGNNRHDIEGARVTNKIMNRMFFDQDMKQSIISLVQYHMTIFGEITEVDLRRLWNKIGKENLLQLIQLKEADVKSLRIELPSEIEALTRAKEKIKEIEKHGGIISNLDLAVTEKDLISSGIDSNKSYVLDCLFEGVVYGAFNNEKQELLQKAHKIASYFN
ncbi:HD domain-containing protein [Natranaerofaba carboxydovora]|uniref:HD domain-containing protein n=1 Tax=Natranaerofaba carboxydovora TaxID=2742683 RepID=UPI001F12EAE8|nr:HD domain-containing protein [Natranaerofaba carboxydovora]UMZ72958.1 putative RNA and SrmB- binding site of polymerase A [Natranaerofaba carboxydovora]